jgi:hypothetical protein
MLAAMSGFQETLKLHPTWDDIETHPRVAVRLGEIRLASLPKRSVLEGD